MNTVTAETLRNEAAAHEAARDESFDRCDTDGFVSQWAHGVNAQLKSAQAAIMENGGTAAFPALFDAETGKRIRAKVIDGKYGACWAVCGADDKFTGEFVKFAYTDRQKANLVQKGYRQGVETVAAWATLESDGRGLSGNVCVVTYRKDKGYPEDAE